MNFNRERVLRILYPSKKLLKYLHDGILCSREKEGAPTLCYSMDGTGEHYAKWNKPGSKRQIQCISPIMGT